MATAVRVLLELETKGTLGGWEVGWVIWVRGVEFVLHFSEAHGAKESVCRAGLQVRKPGQALSEPIRV